MSELRSDCTLESQRSERRKPPTIGKLARVKNVRFVLISQGWSNTTVSTREMLTAWIRDIKHLINHHSIPSKRWMRHNWALTDPSSSVYTQTPLFRSLHWRRVQTMYWIKYREAIRGIEQRQRILSCSENAAVSRHYPRDLPYNWDRWSDSFLREEQEHR